jgi:hypothetical protein
MPKEGVFLSSALFLQVLQSVEDGQVNILYVTPEYIVNKADQLKARLGDLSQVPYVQTVCCRLHFPAIFQVVAFVENPIFRL